MAAASHDDVHVEMRDVSKRFGGAQALVGASLSIRRATVHALVGENGAGKSTLGKVLAGVHAPDAGTVLVDGRSVAYHSPRDARQDRVAIVAQELTLVPRLSVLANVFLGNEDHHRGFRRDGLMRHRYTDLVQEAGFDLPADAPVGGLRLADRQKVELLRALASDARLIVMDEPTAALNADDTAKLLALVGRLRARGVTVVYVSHFLEQVLGLADRVTVLRNGRIVHDGDAAAETTETLVTRMLGRPATTAFPPRIPPARGVPPVLRAKGLGVTGVLHDIDLEVRPGEILGIAGLVGSGRTELARALFGIDPITEGELRIDDRPVRIRRPSDAMRAGVALLPESRKDEGLVMAASVRDNVTLPHVSDLTRFGLVRRARERSVVDAQLQAVQVDRAAAPRRVVELSGGNQQKALFAKWLLARPRVLIADEPTRGVDVGAKIGIYRLLTDLAADGMAVLLISSELEEVLGLAHRILVMRRGTIVAQLDGGAVEEDVMRAAFGAEPKAA